MTPQLQDSAVYTEKIVPGGFWESLGFSHDFGHIIQSIFSYHSVAEGLTLANIVLSIMFMVAVLILVGFLYKIFSYTRKDPLINKLELIPLIMDKNQYDFFEHFCQRDETGTYQCSYTRHNRYQWFTRLGLHGAIYAGAFKVITLLLLFIANTGYLRAFEGRFSANYEIFIDSALAGGGNLASASYGMASSFGEPIAAPKTTSFSYTENTGMGGIYDELHVGFTADTTPLTFGVVSSDSTSYASHTFAALYNGSAGYDIVLTGTSPTNQNNDVITTIGATAAVSTPGTAQFGINLRGNTVPAVTGSDPVGGSGEAVGEYNIINKYAFNSGDIIAKSTTASSNTTFTTTVIWNISPITASGSYVGELVYTIIPKY